MKIHRFILFLVAIAMLAGCNGRPSNVLSTKDMAEVMADIHTAEAVIDVNYTQFHGDSAKMALKEAVFKKHGIDGETFDTSLVWYGHHMDKYMEMYDLTIDILEKRSMRAGNLVLQEAQGMGDSIDVWTASRYIVLSDRLPLKSISFDFSDPDGAEKGDSYTLRARLLEGEHLPVNWLLVANYCDSTVEVLSYNTSSSDAGWGEMTFITDSTKVLSRLRGTMAPQLKSSNKVLWVDSISLIRKPLDAEKYSQRYRQKQYREYR